MLTLVLTRHGLTDRSEPEQHLGQRIDISLNIAGTHQAQALGRRLAPVRFDRVLTSPLFRARETAALLARGVPVEADPRLREMDYGDWEGRTYPEIQATDGARRRDWEQAPDVIPCPGGESATDVARRIRGFLVDVLDEHALREARAAFRASAGSAGLASGVPSPGPTLSPRPAPPTGGGPRVSGARPRSTPSELPPVRRPAPAAVPVPADRPVLVVAHATTNRILLCVALGVPIRDFRRRFVQGQANITVLRWEAGSGPEDGTLELLNDVEHLRAATEAPWA
jgi:broad specificity phosphatase PhoE